MPKPFVPTKVTGARAVISLRVADETRGKLEKAARKSGRPLMKEMEYRLQRSFFEENIYEQMLERVLGGPEVRRIAQTMVAAFITNGQLMAQARGLPEDFSWLKDRDCYRSAAFAAFHALLMLMPGAWDAVKTLDAEIEALKGQIVTGLRVAGKIPAPAPKKS